MIYLRQCETAPFELVSNGQLRCAAYHLLLYVLLLYVLYVYENTILPHPGPTDIMDQPPNTFILL